MNCWKSASPRRIEKHNRVDEAKLHKNTRHSKQLNSVKSTMLPFHSKNPKQQKEQGEDNHPDKETIKHLLRRFVQYKPNNMAQGDKNFAYYNTKKYHKNYILYQKVTKR